MSFLPELEKDMKIVGKDLMSLAPLAITVLGVINPAAGVVASGVYGHFMASMQAAEQTITDAKAGQLRADTVRADWENALSIASEISGKTYVYDKAQLQAFLDSQVATWNQFATFRGTIKAQ